MSGKIPLPIIKFITDNHILFMKKVRVLDVLNSSIVMISPLQKFQREKILNLINILACSRKCLE